MKKVIPILFAVVLSLAATPKVFAHCEVPCGIYGDAMRFDMMAEHIKTIEKSMQQIVELSKEKDQNFNQIVRWVNNKEEHAKKIQEIVYQYFMTQRIKPADEADTQAYKKYVQQLTLLHQMLVYAMKAKQTTDLANIAKLRSLLDSFKAAY